MTQNPPPDNPPPEKPPRVAVGELIDPLGELRQSINALWWLMLLRGVMLVILGIYAMFLPGKAAETLIAVLGIFLIIDGVFLLIAGLSGNYPSRSWIIVRGIVSILIGIFVFAHPLAIGVIAAKVILYVIALGAILTGLFEVVSAVVDRDEMEGEGWMFLSGSLAILFGVMMFMAPLLFAEIFVRVLGVFALIYGISLFTMAVRVRRAGKSLRS